ncbi:PEP-CTERM sorting domain-containing protein [filamentous cyanobacterium CCT1]|nr:PEP-CTERM sorting domain-containing protein [filamentous cyanobacterium CCT1]PSN80899.1 PEP-CTERM sorting domain-containing protein [filamentous cyanobacterium CCP4]
MAAAGLAIGTLNLTLAEPVHAFDFTGSYTPANFTLTNENADGFVDTSGAPASISITGGDNGSFFSGSTKFLTTAAAAGLVSFNWNYSTLDGPFFDPFGFSLNGTFTQLTDNNGGQLQSGTALFNVLLGDVFGFEVQTVDNIIGSATATISNFSAPEPIPTPALLPGLIGLGVAALRKRKGEALAEVSEEA